MLEKRYEIYSDQVYYIFRMKSKVSGKYSMWESTRVEDTRILFMGNSYMEWGSVRFPVLIKREKSLGSIGGRVSSIDNRLFGQQSLIEEITVGVV